MDEATVTMYTTQWCGYCVRLKSQLTRAGVSFREIDIEHDPGAAAFVVDINGGNRTVPTVRFPDGSAATNPSVAEIVARLAQPAPLPAPTR